MRNTRLVILLMTAAVAACDGSDGPMGPAGADGSDGADGATGPPGADWPGPAPAAYTAADGLAGGAAYSKWWTADADGSDTAPTTTAGADF